MKRLLIITAICLGLLLPTMAAPHDDFCYDFRQLAEEEIVQAGGGCIVYRRTYHCTATSSEQTCDEIVCGGNPVPVTQNCR